MKLLTVMIGILSWVCIRDSGGNANSPTTGVVRDAPDFPGDDRDFTKRVFHFENPALGTVTGEVEPCKHLHLFPWKESRVGTKFILSQKSNGVMRILHLQANDVREKRSAILELTDRCKKVVGLIHGFTTGPYTLKPLREILLSKNNEGNVSEYCTLDVDWSKGALADLDDISNVFAQSCANTITAGRVLAYFLYQLCEDHVLKESRIQVIGYSTGAPVAHFAGQYFNTLKAKKGEKPIIKIARMTGFDPVARHFRGYKDASLTRGDASFVDIIHVSGVHRLFFDPHRRDADSELEFHPPNFHGAQLGELLIDGPTTSIGNPDPLGDVDFYPNGGFAPQPQCRGRVFVDLISGLFCSHRSSVEYYIDSLNSSIPRSRRFAVPCAPSIPGYTDFTCLGPADIADSSIGNYMGADVNVHGARGKLFLHYEIDREVSKTKIEIPKNIKKD